MRVRMRMMHVLPRPPLHILPAPAPRRQVRKNRRLPALRPLMPVIAVPVVFREASDAHPLAGAVVPAGGWFGEPAIPASEDVFNHFIRAQLSRQARPIRSNSPPIQLAQLVARLRVLAVHALRPASGGVRQPIAVLNLAHNQSRDPAKHGRNLECRRSEPPIPIYLLQEHPNLDRRIDLTLMHQVPPHHALPPVSSLLTRIHILRQIQPQRPQENLLRMANLVYDPKIQKGVLQHAVLGDGQARGDERLVVVGDLVVLDGHARGAAGVVGGLLRAGGGEVVFDVGAAGDVGDVVEVEDAEVEVEFRLWFPSLLSICT